MPGETRQINMYYLTKITDNDQDLLRFCREMQLIPRGVKCPTCKRIINEPYVLKRSQATTEEIRYVCNKKRCKGRWRHNTVSIRKFTWFDNSKMSIQKSLFVAYCFIYKMPIKDAIRETSLHFLHNESIDNDVGDSIHMVHTGRQTISDYNHMCREICMSIVLDESHDIIGGEGKTVEIDESKFGKRKNNKGRIVDGQWIFGGICRETREMFLVIVPKRDKETLLPIIKSRIRQGTTIISDGWSSYRTLKNEGFTHLVVNHSQNFVDPNTGAHTQNIENLWWQIKRQLPETYSRHDQLYLHLCEYMWRQLRKDSHDLFFTFLQDVAKYYNGNVSTSALKSLSSSEQEKPHYTVL